MRRFNRFAARARVAKIEQSRHEHEMTADPATFSDNELCAAIYRLQTHHSRAHAAILHGFPDRTAQYRDRIRVLVVEQTRRRETV